MEAVQNDTYQMDNYNFCNTCVQYILRIILHTLSPCCLPVVHTDGFKSFYIACPVMATTLGGGLGFWGQGLKATVFECAGIAYALAWKTIKNQHHLQNQPNPASSSISLKSSIMPWVEKNDRRGG